MLNEYYIFIKEEKIKQKIFFRNACWKYAKIHMIFELFQCCLGFFFLGGWVWVLRHTVYRILDLGPGIELGSQKWKCRVLTIGQPGNSLLLCFKKKKTDIWTCYKGNFLRDNGQIKRWEELYLSLRTAITTLTEYWVQKVTFLNSSKVLIFWYFAICWEEHFLR